ncbi:hypothetical protein D3C75_832070 [compost metagenome]
MMQKLKSTLGIVSPQYLECSCTTVQKDCRFGLWPPAMFLCGQSYMGLLYTRDVDCHTGEVCSSWTAGDCCTSAP